MAQRVDVRDLITSQDRETSDTAYRLAQWKSFRPATADQARQQRRAIRYLSSLL